MTNRNPFNSNNGGCVQDTSKRRTGTRDKCLQTQGSNTPLVRCGNVSINQILPNKCLAWNVLEGLSMTCTNQSICQPFTFHVKTGLTTHLKPSHTVSAVASLETWMGRTWIRVLTLAGPSSSVFWCFLGGRHIIQGGMGCICIYECTQTNKINVVQPNMQAEDHE